MSIIDDVRCYYDEQNISPANFHCGHHADCKGDCETFTEAREPYIGRHYEGGTLPRLLFLSLDSGSSDAHPEKRTLKAVREWRETQCVIETCQESTHWYRTHELALRLLGSFNPDLSLSVVGAYFAHTNSAKCCMSNDGRRVAYPRLFKNCRDFIPDELVALQPDILVTQGNWARDAVEFSLPHTRESDSSPCGHAVLAFPGRKVLWIHSHHPRNGGFYRQRKECWEEWARATKEFIQKGG